MRSLVFGTVAVLSAVTLSACANGTPTTIQPGGASDPATTAPATSATSAPAEAGAASSKATTPPKATTPSKTTTSKPAKTPTSDVSELRQLGIDLNKSVLIDVADDGVDRWLQIGKNGVVDFTGTSRVDSTMMALKPAPVAAKNKVLIKPPFWNEDLGQGSCVADTKGAALKLETCDAGRAQQIFTIVPAGDSGQFELKGMYGVIRVDNGKITTSGQGRTGLQTILYAG
ncbi:hypothetical protein JIG36_51300 [Actinoplanes sp. LDG1-06]|uniref:Ricin B lectin domain-containing protein n=1 Tax=Paractinoplanes ovalisporus TaxID=2810368 RepID=A0ABS2AVZ7_9ACTN|nr:hypothetical protein [Actinoplanes ovalisporus]MBM2623905.1 hypothetical protein [Actinoplanes ovalisporus]